MIHLTGPGTYETEVVGESHYQDALLAICGPKTQEGYEEERLAVLVLEDDNPHDSRAIRVEIQGRPVGYLPREIAKLFRKQLLRDGLEVKELSVDAIIRGGWDLGEDDAGDFGVRIDIGQA